MALDFEATSTDTLLYTFATPPTLPITYGCWVRHDTISNQISMSVGDSSSGAYTRVRCSGTGGIFAVGAFDGTTAVDDLSGTGALVANTLTHVAGRFVSDSSREYVLNGTPSGSPETTALSAITMDRVAIGESADNTPIQPLDGKIAEAFVYNVALTDGELAILAAGFSPLFVRPANLIFYDRCLDTNSRNRMNGASLSTYGSPLNSAHPKIIMPRRREPIFVPSVAAAGLSIPIAAYHYNHRMGH